MFCIIGINWYFSNKGKVIPSLHFSKRLLNNETELVFCVIGLIFIHLKFLATMHIMILVSCIYALSGLGGSTHSLLGPFIGFCGVCNNISHIYQLR